MVRGFSGVMISRRERRGLRRSRRSLVRVANWLRHHDREGQKRERDEAAPPGLSIGKGVKFSAHALEITSINFVCHRIT